MSIIYINPYQFAAFDPDALTYISAVETADGQALESGVRVAINDFVLGCKQDGIWNAIKASCILAGARTLTGALVPLVGTAPTNNNFVGADYDRETGLVGNGSTKYLDSNRNNNADPQNSNHHSVYVTATPATPSNSIYIGAGVNTNESGVTNFGTLSNGSMFFRNRSSAFSSLLGAATAVGFVGSDRSGSASFITRVSGGNTVQAIASQTPYNGKVFVFSTTNGVIPTACRLSFYSIGESLDLAKLDTRVSNLITAIDAAIP